MAIELPAGRRIGPADRKERELARLRVLALETEMLLFDLEAHDNALPVSHQDKLQKIHLLVTECRILRGDTDADIDRQIAQAFVEGVDPDDESE